MPFRWPYRIAIADRRHLPLRQWYDLSIEPLSARVGRAVAPNEFFKGWLSCILYFFSQFGLRFANMVFEQQFAQTKANFAWSPRPCCCAAFRVGGKTRRWLLLCEKRFSIWLLCIFCFFLSINPRWTETWFLGSNLLRWMRILRAPSTMLLRSVPRRFGDMALKIVL